MSAKSTHHILTPWHRPACNPVRGWSRRIPTGSRPALPSEFQDGLTYAAWPCLKKWKQRRRTTSLHLPPLFNYKLWFQAICWQGRPKSEVVWPAAKASTSNPPLLPCLLLRATRGGSESPLGWLFCFLAYGFTMWFRPAWNLPSSPGWPRVSCSPLVSASPGLTLQGCTWQNHAF